MDNTGRFDMNKGSSLLKTGQMTIGNRKRMISN